MEKGGPPYQATETWMRRFSPSSGRSSSIPTSRDISPRGERVSNRANEQRSQTAVLEDLSMTRLPRLLLLLWIVSGVCLAQSATPAIEYYRITDDQLCLWKAGDSSAGSVVQKNAQGRWSQPEQSDWIEIVRKIQPFNNSLDPWQ